jgi:two-component sensor histidine kinase
LRQRAILEASLRDGLGEKGALLAELNHRVKNNLQVIASILNLESESLVGEEARDLNDRTRARIKAMHMAHERLFESAKIARIELGAYLRALWDSLIDIYQAKSVLATFELEDGFAGAEEAVPFGLFATEAMTNAILHGVGPGGAREVAIVLRSSNRGEIELTIRDKGPGMPAGSDGLGSRMMDALGAQLKGKVDRGNDEGAIVRLRFPVLEPGIA